MTADKKIIVPGTDRPGSLRKLLEAMVEHQRVATVIVRRGARFLLNYRKKHVPTLLTGDPAARRARIGFLRHAIDVAEALGSDCMSFWSGAADDEPDEEVAWDRLVDAIEPVVEYARKREVVLGFEPEPGMFVDTMNRYDELVERIDSPHFLLTLDLGHLHCLGETPIEDYVRRYGEKIVNMHIEDMRTGVHEHLMFGEGEMNFRPIFEALDEIDFQGGLHVELSRHSHVGPAAAAEAMQFLRKIK